VPRAEREGALRPHRPAPLGTPQGRA
jgi:hypothetical protein